MYEVQKLKYIITLTDSAILMEFNTTTCNFRHLKYWM